MREPREKQLHFCWAVRFLHGSEITGTAAILFLIHTQRLPAAFTPQGLFLQGWICFPIVRPPLDTAGVAAETAPAPGFAALLDRRSAFRAFVDRRVRAVPLRVVVPHPAFAAAEFLPRNVAGWNKALPAVQACQLIRHEAILLVCFFHFTTPGKVHDYLTLTFIYGII